MSEDNRTRFSALSILAAFTLGFLCMGMIVLVVQNLNPQKSVALAPAFEESQSVTEISDSPSFSRRAQTLHLTPKPNPIRKVVVTSPPRPVPQDEIIPEPQPSLGIPIGAPTLPPPVPVAAPLIETLVLNQNPPTGSIIGRALLEGTAPMETPLPLDPNCGRLIKGPATTRHFVTSQNGDLADVFVIVTEGLRATDWPKPAKRALLRDVNCFFEPYISGAFVDQEIAIENGDPVLHNVHVIPNEGKESNFALLPKHSISFRLAASQLFVRLKCDVHPWEFAYITAVTHPFFAVTDKSGQFKLPPLPSGRYMVHAYHRKAGELSQEVEMNENESRSVEFRFHVPTENAPLFHNAAKRAIR
ncbi:MAG: hypothetical protein JWM99_4476 [Verrucomicrobiales bacterium]|nr:hypothetical protein [Verrucomicrobiales bacterium]